MNHLPSQYRTLQRMPLVLDRLGLRKTAVYDQIRDGLLPRTVNLGLRVVGLPADEVDAIIAARVAGSTEDELRALVKRLEAARTDPAVRAIASE